MVQVAYIVKHKDISIRRKSRSGGIFTAVSDKILADKGIVYGCAVNENHFAEHRRATTKLERDAFLGSKYVQSDMRECFTQVKADLEKQDIVLFSGTGCQIAGLKASLNNEYNDRLFTIDIVCHGVPSPKVWGSFLDWMESKYKGKVESVNFRDKRYGWMSHFETVVINGKRRVADYYRAIFYKHYSLRPSCYQCPYSNIERKSDITIADAWGIDAQNADFNDDRGCSLVILNTEKGKTIFDAVKDELEVREVDIKQFMQPNLVKPSFRPSNREQFWIDFFEEGFEFVSQKYGDNTLKGKAISYVKRVLGVTHMTKYVKKILKI
ncbi:MAG: coenzyme F420 hydrogenase [Lachnospiraceae bacterium]|nr:coenzyme F420 hydrogenase [Lachnospiraceae bacterium]